MFQLFLDMKMNPKNCEQALEILYFDENIDNKLGRYAFTSSKVKNTLTE